MKMPPCSGKKAEGCMLLRIQKRIAENQNRLTTRVGKLDINRLSDPATAVIKGFYLRPGDCPEGRGVVVFRKVRLAMGVVDVQHRQIAEDMELTVESDTRMILDSGVETGSFRLAEQNVWGFSMLPLDFHKSATRRSDQSSLIDEQPGYSLVVSDRHVGLARENGMAGLQEVEEIGYSTAHKFWGEKMYAFMYSSTEHVGTVWAVKTVAGLTPPIPNVQEFLLVLARHVSPDFSVLGFLPDRQNRTGMHKKRIMVAPQDAKYPSCLRWPSEMMLVKD
jgi:hypothetical protein